MLCVEIVRCVVEAGELGSRNGVRRAARQRKLVEVRGRLHGMTMSGFIKGRVHVTMLQ